MPALGGPERKLAETSNSSSAPAWSPDGKWLVLADDTKSATEPPGLLALSIETGEKRRLTTPPSGRDFNPAFSPDGRAIAFVRSQSADTNTETGLIADAFVLAHQLKHAGGELFDGIVDFFHRQAHLFQPGVWVIDDLKLFVH